MLCSTTSSQVKNEARVLITGCARSATTYIAEVFKTAGYDFDHELEKGSFGTSSWYLVSDRDRKRKYKFVLHQIRSPLETIASAFTLSTHSFRYICQRLGQYQREDPLMTLCSKYWLYWNQQAQSIADLSYPVEQLPDYLETINQLIGSNLKREHLEKVSKKTNARVHFSLSWEELQKRIPAKLYEEIVEYAKKWGYVS